MCLLRAACHDEDSVQPRRGVPGARPWRYRTELLAFTKSQSQPCVTHEPACDCQSCKELTASYLRAVAAAVATEEESADCRRALAVAAAGPSPLPGGTGVPRSAWPRKTDLRGPLRHLELGHRGRDEQPAHRHAEIPRPARRSRDARAVGRDAGVRVHLAIELRDQHERQPALDATSPTRDARPDARPAVEAGPTRPACRRGSLRATSSGARCRASGGCGCGISQCCVIGTPSTLRVAVLRVLRPLLEVERAGERRQQHELRERDVGLLAPARPSRRTCPSRSLGSPKMNEPSTWTPCWRNACSRATSSSPARLKPL